MEAQSIVMYGITAMTYEDVFQPVEVIILFQHGKVKTLRFQWNERVYKISKVNGGSIVFIIFRSWRMAPAVSS